MGTVGTVGTVGTAWVPPVPGTPVPGSVPPPVSRRPAPPPERRRSPRDIAVGLGAVLALLLLVVGTPLLLSLAIGWPLPHSLPDRAQITQPVTSDVLLKAVAVIVWIAWAQLTACVIVETGAGLRGRGLPRRVPLASPHQALAHKLVAAALLLITAGSAVLAVTGGSGTPLRQADPHTGRPAIAVASLAQAGARGGGPVAQAVSDAVNADVHGGGVIRAGIDSHAASGAHALKVAVVSPPDGAHHDSLWEIAERHLGDGRRYSEIVKLNEGRPQPDGTSLQAASLIRPGWRLLMPADATGLPLADAASTHAGHTPAPAHAPSHTPSRTPAPAPAPAQAPDVAAPTVAAPTVAAPTVAAPVQAPVQAPVADLGWHQPTEDAAPGGAQTWRAPAVTGGIAGVRLPAPAVPAAAPPAAAPPAAAPPAVAPPAAAPPAAAPPAAAPPATAPPQATAPTLAAPAQAPADDSRGPFGALALLSAGMLIALERRRRHQRRTRPVGARVPLVSDEQALLAEAAVRTAADPGAATDLDRALRHLRLTAGDAVPAIYAARITADQLTLRLAHPGAAAPVPWTASADGGAWSLDRAAVAGLTVTGDATSPYPALVTIATDGTDHLLADLSAPRGIVAVTGAHEAALELLAAMAIEHLLDPWAGSADVVTVGLGDVLAGFGRRVHSAGHLGEVLGTLERAYAGPSPVGALTGPSLLAAQGPRAHLLVATQPTPEEVDRLAALAAGGTVTVVVAADIPGAVWTLALDATGGLTLGALALSGRAPRLPAASLDAVLRLLQEADRPVPAGPAQGGRTRFATVDLGGGLAYDDPQLDADLASWRDGDRPQLVLLGQVELLAAGMVPIDRRVALALAARLALHSAGDTVAALGGALGLTEAQTAAGLEQLTAWLGSGHLTVLDGRARLRGVAVDALLAERLARRADSHAGARNRMAALADLDALLGLVRDVPLSGLPPVGLRWTGPDGLREDLDALVGDAAHALASAHLADEDNAAAAAAARAGLRGAPDSELLWADVLTAERAGGDAAGVTEALRALRAEGGPFTERSQAVLRALA